MLYIVVIIGRSGRAPLPGINSCIGTRNDSVVNSESAPLLLNAKVPECGDLLGKNPDPSLGNDDNLNSIFDTFLEGARSGTR